MTELTEAVKHQLAAGDRLGIDQHGCERRKVVGTSHAGSWRLVMSQTKDSVENPGGQDVSLATGASHLS